MGPQIGEGKGSQWVRSTSVDACKFTSKRVVEVVFAVLNIKLETLLDSVLMWIEPWKSSWLRQACHGLALAVWQAVTKDSRQTGVRACAHEVQNLLWEVELVISIRNPERSCHMNINMRVTQILRLSLCVTKLHVEKKYKLPLPWLGPWLLLLLLLPGIMKN